jgi:hypothetical protein
MKLTDIAALLAIGGAGYLFYRGYKAAAANVNLINPASTSNVVYSGVNDIGAVLTNQPAGSFSLGASIWDWTHPSQVAAETQVTSGSVPPPAPATTTSDTTGTDATDATLLGLNG